MRELCCAHSLVWKGLQASRNQHFTQRLCKWRRKLCSIRAFSVLPEMFILEYYADTSISVTVYRSTHLLSTFLVPDDDLTTHICQPPPGTVNLPLSSNYQ